MKFGLSHLASSLSVCRTEVSHRCLCGIRNNVQSCYYQSDGVRVQCDTAAGGTLVWLGGFRRQPYKHNSSSNIKFGCSYYIHHSLHVCQTNFSNRIELPLLERLARDSSFIPALLDAGVVLRLLPAVFLLAAAAHKVNYRLPGERSLTRNFHMDGIRGAQPINWSQVLVWAENLIQTSIM